MSYWSFLKYAKRELALKKSTKTEPNDKTPKKEESNDGPPIAKASFKVGKRFNPHTVDIPKERIL